MYMYVWTDEFKYICMLSVEIQSTSKIMYVIIKEYVLSNLLQLHLQLEVYLETHLMES